MGALIIGLVKLYLWTMFFLICTMSGGFGGFGVFIAVVMAWQWSAGFTVGKPNNRGDHLSPFR